MSPDGGVNQTLADIMTQYFFFCPSFHAAKYVISCADCLLA